MKTFVAIALLMWSSVAYAVPPDASDKTSALAEFTSRESDQGDYLISNGRYKEKTLTAPDGNGIYYRTDAYKGPDGHGYVQYAFKDDGADTYFLTREVGPESRGLPTDWTLIVVGAE